MDSHLRKEKLKEHIEKLIPLTDDEFLFVLSHFSVEKYKKMIFLFSKETMLHIVILLFLDF